MKHAQKTEIKALTYYISSYGKKGTKIFMDDEDRLFFINLLKQQKVKNNIVFYGYVLLHKQYSFLIEISSNNLSKSMHRINSNYANYFNRRHKRKHKLFKDRYSCFIIDKENYLAEISCSLHLLPINDSATESVYKYEWSSLPGYINKKKREDWIDYDCILGMFDGRDQKASINYRRFIKEGLKNPTSSSFRDLKGRIILGSEKFKKEIHKNQHLNRIAPPRNGDGLAKKIIELSTQSKSWNSLKARRKRFNLTILSRNAAIFFLKKYTDMSNQQISTYFRNLNKSSVSQMSRRYNLTKRKHKALKQISVSLNEEIKKIIENV
jgi:putative transposase